eukprot:4626698-Amphidinium_carterae.1
MLKTLMYVEVDVEVQVKGKVRAKSRLMSRLSLTRELVVVVVVVAAAASEPKGTTSSAECRRTPQSEIEEVVIHSELPKRAGLWTTRANPFARDSTTAKNSLKDWWVNRRQCVSGTATTNNKSTKLRRRTARAFSIQQG